MNKTIAVRLPEEIIDILDNSGINRKDYIIDAILLKNSIESVLKTIEEKLEKKIDKKFEELLKTITSARVEIKQEEEIKVNKDNASYIIDSMADFL